ncbi:hypothetical protein CATMQ487_05220 [Sphaerotilus microaerophilus]|jgi:hypothetical protein|uniref:Uncharacterized protein n=2 Tax=Sphaerotilus microaerophilus TaxID=2914710 RepID=A0ABN6PJB6_9BURK|nr:hypothetical protein CATMQ487_05220 [Sphaerotilus sp. FB-5]
MPRPTFDDPTDLRTMRTPTTLTLLAAALAWLGLAATAQAQNPSSTSPSTPSSTPAAATASAGSEAPVDEAASPDGPTLAWSGFGTLGWAQSNRRWGYQRFIDRQGGFERDSLLGAQLDAQLSPEWSATAQLKLAPSERQDNAWDLRSTWAFVAWRPDNDWLLRAGKLRVPFYLRSEHMDVGATYNEARLPAELHNIVPTTDFTGAHLTHSWSIDDSDFSVDVYKGRASQAKRVWLRDGAGPLPSGAMVWDVTTVAQGLVVTWSEAASKVRLGLHRVEVSPRGNAQLPVRPTWAPLGPGFGYWQTSNELPGPGVEMARSIDNDFLSLGFEASPAAGWHLTGEYGRIRQRKTERSIDAQTGYLTLTRELGHWSPYLTFARLFSSPRSREWARQLDETTVPAYVPGGDLLNASMRASADSVPVYDQRSWALGMAHALTPTQRVKAEWLHTRAKVSSMFDLLPGEKLFQTRSVDVLSVNYSFTF